MTLKLVFLGEYQSLADLFFLILDSAERDDHLSWFDGTTTVLNKQMHCRLVPQHMLNQS